MNHISKDDYNKLLGLLYQLRASSGLRQTDLAERLNVPQSFISKLESGERKLDILEFIVYCETFNMNPIEIFTKLVNLVHETKPKIPRPNT